MQNVLWHSVPRMPLAISVEVWWVLPRGVSKGGGRVEPRGNRPCTAWIPKKALGQTGSPPCAPRASALPGWGKCGGGLVLPSLFMTKCFNVAVIVLCSEAWRASRKL